MQKTSTTKPELKLVGLTTRTNNKNEMNPETAKIGAMVGQFFGGNVMGGVSNRNNPGVTFAVYTDYESDEHGDYTYFIGEEVSSFENVSSELQQLTIPAASYQKFTTPSGAMPGVVINAWQQIWKMTPDDFEGKRAYQADFEVYDQRAMDPANTSVDIYIGVTSITHLEKEPQ
jgi:predicted transcriptional regulator YdeE